MRLLPKLEIGQYIDTVYLNSGIHEHNIKPGTLSDPVIRIPPYQHIKAPRTHLLLLNGENRKYHDQECKEGNLTHSHHPK